MKFLIYSIHEWSTPIVFGRRVDYIYIYILYIYIYILYIYNHHHHHHVVPPARISLTLSRHFSLSFIASGRSSGLHPVSSQSSCMYVRAGRPAFARRFVVVHLRALDIYIIYYIYIYIYVLCVCLCVCVCVCVCLCVFKRPFAWAELGKRSILAVFNLF